MRTIIAFLVGALFSVGLLLSGMTDTLKVKGFLDVFGEWDPTLMFVMGGALIPMFFAWKLAKVKQGSVLGDELPLAVSSVIDKNLLLGSALFGIGWGLVGFCPGPNLASLSYGGLSSMVFFISMFGAMLFYGQLQKE